MIIKNFDKWNQLKKEINKKDRLIRFHTREIWWCSLGVNIGFEQDGKNDNFERPVLVLKKFNKDILWVLPLTSADKTGQYYFQFQNGNKKYSVILSQIRLVCKKRFLRRIRKIDKESFNKLRKKFKKLI